MQIVLLDLGQGLGKVGEVLLTIAIILIPIAVGIYILLLRKKVGSLVSTFLSIAATILLAMVIVFFQSNATGAEPFESIFDVELLKLATIISSISTVVILIISSIRFLNRK